MLGSTPLVPPAPTLSAARPLASFLRSYLLEDIIPFWTRHAIDPAGGINTCIRDDGSLVSRDKWLWSQWRAVWVFSELYNLIDRRDEWLDIARQIYDFSTRYGWDENAQGWVLTLDGEGRVLRGCDSIYADGFAIYGCTALARATGDEAVIQTARRTADSVLRRLQQPHDQLPHFPYPVPKGARVHGIPMIFSLDFWELGQLLDDDRYRQAAVAMSDEIFSRFYRRDRDVIVERVAVDGLPLPSPIGTAIVPGHVVEDMWFQIHIAQDRNDRARIEQACRLIRRHMEIGWDAEYGGMFLAVDAEQGPRIGWEFADTKIWWPHTEALYALPLAYEHCGEGWCDEWFARVWRYSFEHYPVSGHGEWRQKLDRRGQPLTAVVALPVKDPFHLPRALMYCILSLERIASTQDKSK